MTVSQEALQRERPLADIAVCGDLLDDSASVEAAYITLDVCKYFLLCLFFQDDLATERCIRKATLNLFLNVS